MSHWVSTKGALSSDIEDAAGLSQYCQDAISFLDRFTQVYNIDTEAVRELVDRIYASAGELAADLDINTFDLSQWESPDDLYVDSDALNVSGVLRQFQDYPSQWKEVNEALYSQVEQVFQQPTLWEGQQQYVTGPDLERHNLGENPVMEEWHKYNWLADQIETLLWNFANRDPEEYSQLLAQYFDEDYWVEAGLIKTGPQDDEEAEEEIAEQVGYDQWEGDLLAEQNRQAERLVQQQISSDEAHSIRFYNSSSYREFNRNLREGNLTASD